MSSEGFERVRGSATRSARRKGMLLVLASIAALLAAELGLRVAGLPERSLEFLNPEPGMTEVFARDPALFWKLRRDGTLYRVNEHGTRGHWPAGPKRAGEVRIACVGDSCALGVGVRYEDTFGLRLEQALRARRPDLDVTCVLAANTGYSTYQSRLLCERSFPELAPDWTVLYCGAWNDYVAAIGAADAERAARERGAGSLRLVRLVRDAFLAPRRSSADYRAAMAAGVYPDGPRVPLPAFRENLRALVAAARVSGRVLLVVPPLPAETEESYPIALDYRAAVADVARETGAPYLDGPALFRETLAGVPDALRTDAFGRPLLFTDWVHPSAFGHRVLADALLELVALDSPPAEVDPWSLSAESVAAATPESISESATTTGSASPSGSATVAGGAIDESVTVAGSAIDESATVAGSAISESATVHWSPPTELVVRGRGFLGPDGPVLRAWLGEHWLEGVEVVDDTTLRLSTRLPLRSGPLALALVTPRGTRAAGTVVVEGPAVRAELALEQGERSLRAEIRGEPGDGAALWVSDALRAAPLVTPYGPLWIATDGDGRPPGRPDLPFRVDLAQPVFVGTLDERGVFAIEVAIPPGAEERAIHVQGGLLRGDVGALSAVARPR